MIEVADREFPADRGLSISWRLPFILGKCHPMISPKRQGAFFGLAAALLFGINLPFAVCSVVPDSVISCVNVSSTRPETLPV